MNKFAAIDLGSNMAQLLIQINQQEEIYQDFTALGDGLHIESLISMQAINRTIEVLKKFKEIILTKGIRISDVIFCATEACRQAKNQFDFFEKIKSLGFNPQILTEEQEAYYSCLGVLSDISIVNFNDYVSLDIGGASTELAILSQDNINKQFHLNQFVSLKIGTLLVAQLLKQGGLNHFLNSLKSQHINIFKLFYDKTLVCTRGTMTTIFNLALDNRNQVESTYHNAAMTSNELSQSLSKLEIMTVNDLLKNYPYLEPRLPTLFSAIKIVKFLIEELNPRKIILSQRGLVHGALKYHRSSQS